MYKISMLKTYSGDARGSWVSWVLEKALSLQGGGPPGLIQKVPTYWLQSPIAVATSLAA